MLSAGLDAIFGRVPFAPVITVLDALLIVVLLMGAVLTLIETRKLRNRPTGTNDKAVARQRSLLAMGWPFVLIGGFGLCLDFFDILDDEPVARMRVLGELALLIFGVVCLRCRRILDSPPQVASG